MGKKPASTAPPAIVRGGEFATGALALALLVALGLFFGLGVTIERDNEARQLRTIGEQQHALTKLIRRAVDSRLGVLAMQLGHLAEILAEGPHPQAMDEDGLRLLTRNIVGVHPEITALGFASPGGPPVVRAVAFADSPLGSVEALAGWLRGGHTGQDRLHLPTPFVTGDAPLLGMLTRVNRDGRDGRAGGVLGIVVDLELVLGRYLQTMDTSRMGLLTVFDQSGVVLYAGDRQRVGTLVFPPAPEGDSPLQAAYRSMLRAPSGSKLLARQRPVEPHSCRILSWDSLTLGGRAIYIALGAEEHRVATHLVTAGRRRLLLAGLFSLALVAVVTLFVRSRAQRRLSYHNRLLETQQNTSPDGILVVDAQGVPAMWNARLPAVLGTTPEAVPADEPWTILSALERALSGGDFSFFAEFSRLGQKPEQPLEGREVRLGDGRVIEVHSRGFSDDKGRMLGRVWHLRDVSRRLRTQDALRSSREQLQSIIDNVPSMVYLRDTEGRYILTNRLYNRFFGWAADHAMGRSVDELLPPDIAGRIRTSDATLLHTGRPQEYEETVTSVDGPRTMLTREAPIRGERGAVTAICGISTDITARKATQTRLRNTLEEFESIFDNSLVGVLLQRGGRTIVRANARAGEILGYVPDELVGKNSEFLHLDREHHERFGSEFFAALDESPVLNVEFPLRHRRGHAVWCQFSGKALKPDGADRDVLWVFDDITERKNLERLRDDVEVIMRHDLKTPLSTVIHAPQLLEEDGNLNAEQREILGELKSAGYRMLEMINRSLDILKMERGTYELRPKPFDLVPLLRTVLRDLRSLAARHRLKVELRGPSGPLGDGAGFPIHGERLLCYSMFANLLKNAMEASPDGGTVRLTLDHEGGPGVAIHNQGVVPPKLRERFFEKYASSGKTTGTGLGTYSARLIAEAHGGRISMRTGERDGTTVTVRLPGQPGGGE